MRRWRHRLVVISAAICLLLSISLVGLWVRSYRFHDRYWSWPWVFRSADGRLWVSNEPLRLYERNRAREVQDEAFRREVKQIEAEYGGRYMIDEWSSTPAVQERLLRVTYSAWQREESRMTPAVRRWVPHAFPAIFFAALAAVCTRAALIQYRRNVRREANCCVACGYDLRATPGRCPECGAVGGGGG